MGLQVLIGAGLGFLSGIGVGGGSLLIVWLTQVMQEDLIRVRSINLMFFLSCAAISCIFRWKQGDIPVKMLMPGILAGCICSALFSAIGVYFAVPLLKQMFGILLIVTGLREIFRKSKNNRES